MRRLHGRGQTIDLVTVCAELSDLVVLRRRETDSASVTPCGPIPDRDRTNAEVPGLESRAGLNRALTARRHRHKHHDDGGRRIHHGESALRDRD